VADTGNTNKLSCQKSEKHGYLGSCGRIILKWILVLKIRLVFLRIREEKAGFL